MTTNVPRCSFGPTGFTAPPETAILAGVQLDINTAFNGNLNPGLTTPQGQLASSITGIVGDTDQTFVFYTNMVDPAFSSGRMQDGIGRIYFLQRKPALPTTVACTCTGLPGVQIPVGSLAQDLAENIYAAVQTATIGPDGTVSMQFSNTVPGPTPCPSGTLTAIYQAIPNWDSITNATDGVLGQNTETRAQFEERRQESVAGNARSQIFAIQGAVRDVAGVIDAVSYSNNTSSPVTWRGKTIDANSIYVAAVGGADADVAQAIWTKAPPGIPYVGNTTITVYDNNPDYSDPLPSYDISFERPPSLPVYFSIVLANGPNVPADAVAQVQAAIIKAFTGGDGGARARIASTLYATRYVPAVQAIGSWVSIIDLLIGSPNSADATFTGVISTTTMTVSAVGSCTLEINGIVAGIGVTEGTQIVNQLTGTTGASVTAAISGTVMNVTAVGSGVLHIGQIVNGAGVTPATTIISFGSGTGNTGTYNLSNSMTVGSEAITTQVPGGDGTYTVSVSQTVGSPEAMTSSTPNQNFVSVDADQAPTTSNPDILVVVQ